MGYEEEDVCRIQRTVEKWNGLLTTDKRILADYTKINNNSYYIIIIIITDNKD
jgi:hypothetical protein